MTAGASILERIIEPQTSGFSIEHARFVLSLNFSPEERSRYDELARKGQDGELTEEEEGKLNEPGFPRWQWTARIMNARSTAEI